MGYYGLVHKNKFGAKKTYVAGMKFDSKKESERYLFLRGLQTEKKIRNLRCQVPFLLTPCDVKYVADFVYEKYCPAVGINGSSWVEVIEDVKGGKATITDGFKIKKNMMLRLLGKEVHVIMNATAPLPDVC